VQVQHDSLPGNSGPGVVAFAGDVVAVVQSLQGHRADSYSALTTGAGGCPDGNGSPSPGWTRRARENGTACKMGRSVTIADTEYDLGVQK